MEFHSVTRASQALLSSEAGGFRYGQLLISSVNVDGQTYQVSFLVVDKHELILELVSIVDEFNREQAANYDVQSLILQIPGLGYYVFPDDMVYFDVEMVLLTDADPILFPVIRAYDVEE